MAAHRLPPKILNGLQSFLTFSCLDELESCFYFWFWRRVCKCLNITAFRTDGVYAFQSIGSIMFDRYDKRFLSATLFSSGIQLKNPDTRRKLTFTARRDGRTERT